MDAAKEIAADPAATQDAIDAAWKALMTEIHKLGFVKGDITSLEALVSLAEGYDMNDYVEAGQAEFLEALKAAQDLLADKDNAMQAEIETAESNLLNAMLNLRYKADKSILGRCSCGSRQSRCKRIHSRKLRSITSSSSRSKRSNGERRCNPGRSRRSSSK